MREKSEIEVWCAFVFSLDPVDILIVRLNAFHIRDVRDSPVILMYGTMNLVEIFAYSISGICCCCSWWRTRAEACLIRNAMTYVWIRVYRRFWPTTLRQHIKMIRRRFVLAFKYYSFAIIPFNFSFLFLLSFQFHFWLHDL